MRMKHTVLALALLVTFGLTSCSTMSKKAAAMSAADSLRVEMYNSLDSPQMMKKRAAFGAELTGKDAKVYREHKLNRFELKKWMLHMEAVYGMTIENKDDFFKSKWTMYRLDTLEHKFVTIEQNTSVRGEVRIEPRRDQ